MCVGISSIVKPAVQHQRQASSGHRSFDHRRRRRLVGPDGVAFLLASIAHWRYRHVEHPGLTAISCWRGSKNSEEPQLRLLDVCRKPGCIELTVRDRVLPALRCVLPLQSALTNEICWTQKDEVLQMSSAGANVITNLIGGFHVHAWFFGRANTARAAYDPSRRRQRSTTYLQRAFKR